MVLDRFRGEIDPILSKLARYVIKINPDVFTWLSLLFATLAGLTFYLSSYENSLYLPIASLFIFINGLLDAIDGKVAKINKKNSPRGDFLDHVIDRYADIFIVGGLSLSLWCDLRIGFFAIIGMFLTSYMGTQAQAVGYKRVYSGLLGRADRLTLLMIIPVLQ
ncbi:MAG: CDP-alcohol phosphatidyltransferase family protein, partial [Thermoplasmata archaeon]